MIIFSILAAAVMACPVDHAHYALRGAPDVTLDFRPVDSGTDWPSRLAIRARFASSGDVFWWLPWNGGTDGLLNVASTTDVTAPGWRPPDPDGGPRPHGNMTYLANDARYNFIGHVPVRGNRAPAHILLANLSDAEFDHGRGYSVRGDTHQFFDLISCGAHAG